MTELLGVFAVALGAVLVVGLAAVAVLLLMKRASIVLQLCVISLATVLSVGVGLVGVVATMGLAPADFAVVSSVVGVSALGALALSLFLGRWLVQNSRDIVRVTRSIGDGEAVQPVARNTNNEFAVLENELTGMRRKLDALSDREAQMDRSRRQLVAWMSHDLRTPLAGIRAMAEALEDGVAEDPERYHRQLKVQVARLDGMVTDLLEISRLSAGSVDLDLQVVSLYDIVSDTLADLAPVAAPRSIRLVGAGAADLSILADPRELSRVVDNLVMNAIDHSPDGAEVTVTAASGENGQAVISVTDSAGGIPEKDLERVFEAGWRASGSRSPAAYPQRSGGAGLGLAIVRGIVEAHKGEVRVQNVAGGCRFDVLLPRLAQTA